MKGQGASNPRSILLLAQRDELQRRGSFSLTKTERPHHADRIEVAQASEDIEEIAVKSAVLKRNLADVETVLGKTKNGTYEICADCHERIPPDRLEAQPTASRCRSCQEKYDSCHKSCGVSSWGKWR